MNIAATSMEYLKKHGNVESFVMTDRKTIKRLRVLNFR